MKKIFILIFALLFSACNINANPQNNTQPENCNDISRAFTTLAKHDLFNSSPSSTFQAFSGSFDISEKDTEYREDIDLSYKLRPKYDAWTKAPEMVYNFDEIQDNRDFVNASFHIKQDCFKSHKDLIDIATQALGSPSFTSDWDDATGMFATWDKVLPEIDTIQSITVNVSNQNYSIIIRSEPHALDAP